MEKVESEQNDTILPPSATTQMRDIEAATARLEGVPVIVQEVWSSEDCPLVMLPYLAWARSVDTWSDSWTETQKRQAISASLEVHRHKGTKRSVQEAVNALGANIIIREWFETGGEPYTFTCILAEGSGGTDEFVESLMRTIDLTRPERCTYEVHQGIDSGTTLAVASKLNPAVYTRTIGLEWTVSL
ncbi:phage tail P2-like protein [Sinobacterium caligoides]|uniref:Phage tail P2-like protein n=1 Tax=Sinobacterium caligoides TaxID=933926 RepID=A0A3N2E0S8_9GAMM|nr:phage tail protein I [Sinobacterium caligoides]ROS05708.1 phage tail P2-like protein [Sinobacterium caligoides]